MHFRAGLGVDHLVPFIDDIKDFFRHSGGKYETRISKYETNIKFSVIKTASDKTALSYTKIGAESKEFEDNYPGMFDAMDLM